MSAFADPLPHGGIDEIFPDVFLVHGTFRSGPGISFGRNMIVLREGDTLTVVNAVRLTPDGRPQALRPDSERLLSHDFAHLVSAHGEVLRDTARADLRRSCATAHGME